ncbi:MAG: sugar transporter permease [Microbacteriaceae bacterium]|nr:sugar transporter permease [Microbacteriaceae bacterium]
MTSTLARPAVAENLRTNERFRSKGKTARKQEPRRWLLTLIGLLLLLIFLFPIYWMIATSFKSEAQAFSSPPRLFPWPIDLTAWHTALSDPSLGRYLVNSLILGFGTAIFTLALAAPAAYALTHLKVAAKGVVLAVSLTSLMFPAVMLVMPLYQVFAQTHLLNSYLGLILANSTLTVPFSLLLMRPLISAIPHELVEAAQLDGASMWGVFWRIILPLARPALATTAVFAFLMSWGDLVFAISLTSSNTMWPITAGLWNAIGQNVTNWPQLTAMATIALLPTAVVFLLAQRFVVSGLASSGLKD